MEIMTTKQIQKEFLTETNELLDILNHENLVIIDTREPEDYIISHIPGAINLYDIFTYLATKENGGYEAMRKTFARLFGTVGVNSDTKVVVYEDAMDNGYGRSCRGLFILKYLGHKNVTVLHGGFQAWLLQNLPTTKEIPVPAQKDFVVSIDNSMIVDSEEMLAALNNPNVTILDVRDHAEWIGVSSSPYGPNFAPRKGRLPRAKWLEWYNMMKNVNSIPWFKEPEELKKLFAEVGVTPESNVIIYCFKGARTSNVFICMKMAGIKNVKCYFSAWNDWSRDFSLPIETGYPKHS